MVVQNWVRKRGFQYGCLIETRVKENKVKRILEMVFPGWSYITNYDHHLLGRLWVIWSPRVRVTPCSWGSTRVFRVQVDSDLHKNVHTKN